MMKNKSSWIFISFIFLIFLLFLWISTNLDVIYSTKANYYYKKNNIGLAQKYYERAFETGLDDSNTRERYINSIINSPLTIDAQERLFKFLENPQEDNARLKAEYFLYDIQREIHNKYSENYINNTVYNQKVLRWSKLPITYGFEGKTAPQYFIKEIENAFNEWEKATNNRILFIEDEKSPNIIIKFNQRNSKQIPGKKFVVAYTTPTIISNKLINMEIIFYTNDPQGRAFTKNQVYNTALHEIAHALGFMGHSDDKDHVMYYAKDSVINSADSKVYLTEADINTISLLYKTKPEITDSNSYKADYIPQLILGSKKEILSDEIKEAENYIEKAPHLPAGYIDLAEGYVVQKDYPKAIKNLEKALQLADSEEIKSMIYLNLAIAYFYIDNLEISKDYLKKSIAIEDSEDRHYLLSEIYVREGNYSEAIKEYSALIQRNPKNIEYTIALTNIYIINRNFLKARKTLRYYVKNNPEDRNNPRFAPYGILKMFL